MKTNFQLNQFMSLVKKGLIAPLKLLVNLLPEDPTERLWREHFEREAEKARIAAEKIETAYRNVPEMQTNRDPDFLLGIISDRTQSAEARGEAYALILGTTPPGQPVREPLSLTDEQCQKLVDLICSEEDDEAEIDLKLFVDQAGLQLIYKKAPVSEIRAKALNRMITLERNLLLMQSDIDERRSLLPHHIQVTETDRETILNKIASMDGGVVKFDLTDAELPPVLDDYLKDRNISAMRGHVWKCASPNELRDALIQAQKENFIYGVSYFMHEIELQKDKIDDLIAQCREEDEKLLQMIRQKDQTEGANSDIKGKLKSIKALKDQTRKEKDLMSQIQKEEENLTETANKLEKIFKEKEGKASYPPIYAIIEHNFWTETIFEIMKRIRFHESKEFLLSLVQDLRINDENAADILACLLYKTMPAELQDQAVYDYINSGRPKEELIYWVQDILNERYEENGLPKKDAD